MAVTVVVTGVATGAGARGWLTKVGDVVTGVATGAGARGWLTKVGDGVTGVTGMR